MTYRQSPEARARTNARRNALTKRRYEYVRDVLGAPYWKARMARDSVSSLVAMFPEHEFPPELLARAKPGPQKGAKYRRRHG